MSGRSPQGGRDGNGSRTPSPRRRPSPSPAGRRPRGRSGGRGVVIERVIEKSSAAIVYPVLTRSNYAEWALVMQVNLQAAGLWDAIELGTDDYREDRSALAALLRAVPVEMQAGLARKESAADAWEAIRAIQMGGDRIKEATADKLRRDFGELQFKSGECMEDFSLRVSTVANQLRALGDKISDKEVIKKILHSVPDYLEQVAISIETLLDLNSMSIEEATSHLRAVEERKKKSPTGAKEGRLLLTEEEWMAWLKIREGESSGGGGRGGKGRGKGRRGGRGGGGRGGAPDSSDDGARRAKASDVCRSCGKTGHWAKECRSKNKRTAQAHVAEEEEMSLLLAEVCEIEKFPIPSQIQFSLPSPLVRDGAVHLVERKVVARLGGENEAVDPERWVVDTGASNHMTGARSAFTELDAGVSGTVRFGDGSVVRIEGCGTVVFSSRSGEHRIFSGIYYIPRLKTSILSVGQLDEIGYETRTKDGVMTIKDAESRLVARVPRAANRLYVLYATIAQPVCLMAHGAEEAWRWHARLGHMNFRAMKMMASQG
jgi:uncharacterized membrane protein YgcG